ncbi:MAG: hypothetical protein GF353_15740, partial [Candidatus Lokiarchaeota archaeon]|nr:hypothetical protein [Candidatus Lokiarchaeota archaeon]
NKFIIEEKDKAAINYYRDTLLNNKHFKELYEEILHYWELKKDSFEFSAIEGYEKGVEMIEFFPPCVKEILSRAKEGQNLIHIERLFLVFFLHALNYPKEEIVKIFSILPDFDLEKTTYQVEFAKNKNYTPHSCDTLKSYNLCKAEKYKDELCIDGYYSKKYEEQKKISHPVFYFQFKKYVSSNKNKQTNSD